MPKREKEGNLSDAERFDQYWNSEDQGSIENPNSDKVYQKLRIELFPVGQSRKLTLHKAPKWFGYAAAIILITGGIFFYVFQSTQKSLVTVITGAGESRTIVLPDHSQVEILENSELSYSRSLSLNLKRSVNLKGNALFKVFHDEEKPFEVIAGDLIVKDIGTIFNVIMNHKNGSSKVVKISVIEGSISIQKKTNDKERIILTKGEEVLYNTENKFILCKVDSLKIDAKSVEFDHANITEVLSKLSATYGVTIEKIGSTTTQKSYSGKFENESIDRVLEMIGFTLNFNYSRKKDSILISFDKK